jgi:hypothetical protein
VLVGVRELVDVVVRELRWLDDADVDSILSEHVVDVPHLLGAEARLAAIWQHECPRRRPATGARLQAGSHTRATST